MKNENEKIRELMREKLDACDEITEIANAHLKVDSFFLTCAVEAWLGNMPFEVDNEIFVDLFIFVSTRLGEHIKVLGEQLERYWLFDDELKELRSSDA